MSEHKYMIVLRKKNPPVPVVPLKLFSSALERIDCYKYLGILLIDNLSWSTQIESVCQKARRVLGLLYNVQEILWPQATQESMKQLYLSLVQPHLEYACQVGLSLICFLFFLLFYSAILENFPYYSPQHTNYSIILISSPHLLVHNENSHVHKAVL